MRCRVLARPTFVAAVTLAVTGCNGDLEGDLESALEQPTLDCAYMEQVDNCWYEGVATAYRECAVSEPGTFGEGFESCTYADGASDGYVPGLLPYESSSDWPDAEARQVKVTGTRDGATCFTFEVTDTSWILTTSLGTVSVVETDSSYSIECPSGEVKETFVPYMYTILGCNTVPPGSIAIDGSPAAKAMPWRRFSTSNSPPTLELYPKPADEEGALSHCVSETP